MGYRSAPGVISLSRKYGPERVEVTCTRAAHLKIHLYPSVKSSLAAGLDRQPLPQLMSPGPPVKHTKIRGAEYYLGGAKPVEEVGWCRIIRLMEKHARAPHRDGRCVSPTEGGHGDGGPEP